ncbi:MFS transporter [Sphingobium sp. RAC03]|uniref:MFS transporter n=1 Tax=Sphingobium sp. RAC03 TaxID=1843368 RepID=UPI00083D3E34|nr:MFS transporter [Sphingobium sp. RAC03]AOF95950.1 major Facilitator Superfamily protein [Sphingobium sp. RAC03]
MRHATTRHGVILMLAAVMPTMAIIALVPVLPLLLREFADVPGAAVLVPMALTVPALCVALFSPLAGWLSDRLGRKRLLIGALLGYAGFGLLPLLLDSLYAIFAVRVALGLAEAVIMTVATAMVGDYFEGERRERWVSIQIATASVSAIALIAMGGALGELFGSRGPFWMYLLALPVAAAAAIILFEPHKVAKARTGLPDPSVLRSIGGLVAITFGIGLLFYTIVVQLGPVIEATGVTSPALIGVAGAAANVGVMLGSLLFGRVKARPAPHLLAWGLPLVALGYVGVALSTDFALTVASSVVICIGNGLMLPTMLAWVLRRLPPATRGRGTGVWTGAFFLAQFVAPIVATALSSLLGGMAGTFLFFSAAAAIGAGVALLR